MDTLVSDLKNVITHNIAQQLVAGTSQDKVYEYLGAVARYLFEQNMSVEDVHDIYIHALHHSVEEVDIIMQISQRYGIKIQVKGHGASSIHPSICLEKYFSKQLAI